MKPESASRKRVLDVAEKHFTARGYKAVTLKDITREMNIRQASLYYHVPGGKEELFIEVMVRHLERHRDAMTKAIENGPQDLPSTLRRVAAWMLAQPPINMGRLIRTDLPELPPQKAKFLFNTIRQCMIMPLETFFEKAAQKGLLRVSRTRAIAGAFLTNMGSIHGLKPYVQRDPAEMAEGIIDMLLNGILRR